MKSRRTRVNAILIALAFAFLAASAANAEPLRLVVDAFYNSPAASTNRSVAFAIKITDLRGVPAPGTAITTISIISPSAPLLASKTFSISVLNSWDEFRQEFFTELRAADFGISGIIPAGTYTVSAKIGSVTVRGSDTLPDFDGQTEFLPLPLITSPIVSPSASTPVQIATRTPTIRWNTVPGAKVYRLQLIRVTPTPSTPVFFGENDVLVPPPLSTVASPSFTIPSSVLKAATTYAIRIEARDDDKNADRRSITNWGFFRTP